ncbi:ABC transporter substrate-binding protein [Streptoalloteichus tenebrarius]|uniref:ABC transporter substrate-binding protein n=1 Tax=Streptoalloteichus tenebrarius (strain ATCC 17920 / DSM 40477 / JCM 4838 / CBS 697.72 / NBRC 16177 / NCIMB 11028 / NRRL B-12390 / A12253. 1 / ISP 5477) TaxID=1933 RepID=UPI0026468268
MAAAPRPPRRTRAVLAVLALVPLLTTLGACSRADRGPSADAASDRGPAAELRLGYFPNVTHASALIGVDKEFFARELGSTKLTTQTFNAGPEEVSALLGGSLDAGFIGSGPAINAFAKSEGEAVRLVAGATSGGAQLVVKPGITAPEQLRGRVVATPQLGNTQDVALKKWLADKGLAIGDGPDKVRVTNADNPRTLEAFRGGEVDAAWLPEPWSSRLVLEAGAQVLVDERDLWEGGQFPTTVLIVRTQFLREHPKTVEALLRGQLAATEWAAGNQAEARAVVNKQLEKLTGKALSQPVLDRAFTNIQLTTDPLARTFPRLAKDGVTAGVTRTAPELAGFADLRPLNTVLAAAGKPGADAAGLQK